MVDLASRRRFFTLAAATASAAAFRTPMAWAAGAPALRAIDVVTRVIDVKGKAATVYGLVGPDGRRGAQFVAGESFYVRLSNKIPEPTLIHWHGLTPPSHQDGVPVLSHDPIAPDTSYVYDFRLTEPGTYWMHTHFSLAQMQRLMAAPLIIRDPAERHLDEQEVVVMLNDFTFRNPDEILAELGQKRATEAASGGASSEGKSAGMAGMSGMAGMAGMSGMAGTTGTTGMTGMTGTAAMPGMSTAPAASPPKTGDAMAGMQMDLNDIDFDAYLANDRTLDDPEVVQVEAGGRVRLRIIAASASTNFLVDLGALEGELIAVDGQAIVPIKGRQFPLAMAQRVDVRLRLPAGGGAYPILAQREGDTVRTGIILASKAARVDRVSDQATAKAGVVGLDLDHQLRPQHPLRLRPVDRTHTVALGGDMAKYIWTMNGAVYGKDQPLLVALGERVEIVMRNDTGMAHPMHLHGTIFQVVEIAGKRINGARRDTVMVPPQTAVTVAFDADNAGRWAFHCHNSYHQEAGMMTSVEYV